MDESTMSTISEILAGLNELIDSKEEALQFVLEELDAARQGNHAAQAFVKRSGFNESDYVGAMSDTGFSNVQDYLLNILIPIAKQDMDASVLIRTTVVDKFIDIWGLRPSPLDKDNFPQTILTENSGEGRLPFCERWSGGWLNAKEHGQGTYHWIHGSTFEGEMYEGEMLRGIMKFSSGQVWEGGFLNGEPNGHGFLYENDGSCYEGCYRDDGPNGEGIYKSWNSKQTGIFCGSYHRGFSGKYELFGAGVSEIKIGDDGSLLSSTNFSSSGEKSELQFGSGIYEGDVSDGKANGFGCWKSLTTSTEITGHWFDGEPFMLCKHKRLNEVYYGNIINSLRDGKGCFEDDKGNKWKGDWSNGQLWGKAAVNYANGDSAMGDWVEGVMNGLGYYRYSKGLIYEGGFIDGQFSGLGRLTFSDGWIFEGQFPFKDSSLNSWSDEALKQLCDVGFFPSADLEMRRRYPNGCNFDQNYSDALDSADTHRIIITPPIDPVVELDSVQGAQDYKAQLAKLSSQELCIEFSNVMAAKNNEMAVPASLSNFAEKQSIVTDLTDKATMICLTHFGPSQIIEYCGGDASSPPASLEAFNILINEVASVVVQNNIDEQLDVPSETLGRVMFDTLSKSLMQHSQS
jgi:hypothetical protein